MAQPDGVLSFGPFTLAMRERLLLRAGVPVALGARALDMLIALASHPGVAMGKRELTSLVWPDVTVDEGSLRFHIAILRKALGDGVGGARYIETLAGRGYCFVAPITRSVAAHRKRERAPDSFPGANLLPPRLERMVGREDEIRLVGSELAGTRFVTVTGPGGVGKTTVAIAVAHSLSEKFARSILFLDLGALTDADMVATTLLALLGISGRTEDSLQSLGMYLRDKRLLLVLDNCEHVVDTVARLTAHIFAMAPQVYILATSREALRVEGEHVHALPPLALPKDDRSLALAAAQGFPAIELFLDRAAASGARLDLGDRDAATLARICRRLDGLPLAIELAAGRVQAHGLEQTLAILDQRLTMLWLGQRNAPPRQRTLQATLDWSFSLLSEPERLVLCRLAAFAGSFSLDAALDVAASPPLSRAEAIVGIESLVAKSMVTANPIGAAMRYRLLDTTRAYIRETRVQDAERRKLAARHAEYYRRWLEETGARWPTFPTAADRAPHVADLANVLAALEWCFGPDGRADIGIELVTAVVPALLALSLLTECRRWSKRAISALDDNARGSVAEMKLTAALGLAVMFTQGNTETACAALNRSLSIAEKRADLLQQVQTLALLHTFHHRIGEFRRAMDYARRAVVVADSAGIPAAVAAAHAPLGSSLHHTGDLARARAELEAVLRQAPGPQRTPAIYLGFDHSIYAGIALARTLWLQGYPARALHLAHQTVQDAERMDHPVTLSIALSWAVTVFLWAGDLRAAEEHTNWFVSHAESHSLTPYLSVGRGFTGALALLRGDAATGVDCLQSCQRETAASRYGQLTTSFNGALVQGLAALGRSDEAISLIDATIHLASSDGPLSLIPELLRIKGQVLLSLPEPRPGGAEKQFIKSIEWSRRQGAHAWELRTAIDLAALWAARGSAKEAKTLLHPVFALFTEGLDTADPRAAAELLDRLG
ncbi:ATP-binding protein [Falsiroseomonas sp. HW251]|uniref:ATP-binding protein n=1 Tax=Falsiroseomonas sp. HW251 TaxID=3390998 RepID=UPI003D312B33